MRLVKPAALFQQVLKTCVSKQGRLLGLDVGSKYVGLAVSDEHNKVAIPLRVLEHTEKNINVMAQEFQTLVTQHSLAGFVVGFPFNIQGQPHVDDVDVDNWRKKEQALRVNIFIKELRKTSMLDGVSYTYWDENWSSRHVEVLLEELFDMDPVYPMTILDKFAAVNTLQLYLDDMNRRLDYQGRIKEEIALWLKCCKGTSTGRGVVQNNNFNFSLL